MLNINETPFDPPAAQPGTLRLFAREDGRLYTINEFGVRVWIQGSAGSQGASGAQGATGPQGSAGSIGATGSQGLQGATGVQGSMGAQGTQGVQGATGVQGAQGAQGDQGLRGFQGAVGATGPEGPEGPQGESGESLWMYTSTLNASQYQDTLTPISFYPTTRIGDRTVDVDTLAKLTVLPDPAFLDAIEVTGASISDYNGLYFVDGESPAGFVKYTKTGTPNLYISINSTTNVWYCIDTVVNPVYFQAQYCNYNASGQPIGKYWNQDPVVPDEATGVYSSGTFSQGVTQRNPGQTIFNQTMAQTHGADYFRFNEKTRPPIAFTGLSYWDTSKSRLYVGDGTTWQEMSTPRTYTITSNDDFKAAIEDTSSLYKVLNVTQAVSYMTDTDDTVWVHGYITINSVAGSPTAFLHSGTNWTITFKALSTSSVIYFSQASYTAVPGIDHLYLDDVSVNFELVGTTQHTVTPYKEIPVTKVQGTESLNAASYYSGPAFFDPSVVNFASIWVTETPKNRQASTIDQLTALLAINSDLEIDLMGKTIAVTSNVTVNGTKTLINGYLSIDADITIDRSATLTASSLTCQISIGGSNRTITVGDVALFVDVTFSNYWHLHFAWNSIIPFLKSMAGIGWTSGVQMDFSKPWCTNYPGMLRTLLAATTAGSSATKIIEWQGDSITTWNGETSQTWSLTSSLFAGTGVSVELRCAKTLTWNLEGKTLQIGDAVVKLGDFVINAPNNDFKGNGHLLAYNVDFYLRGFYNSVTGSTFYLDGSQPGGSAANKFYHERRDTIPNTNGHYSSALGVTDFYNVDPYVHMKWWSSN